MKAEVSNFGGNLSRDEFRIFADNFATSGVSSSIPMKVSLAKTEQQKTFYRVDLIVDDPVVQELLVITLERGLLQNWKEKIVPVV